MRLFTPVILAVASVAFLETVLGSSVHNSDSSLHKRHTLVLGKNTTFAGSGVSGLEKRFENARFSFYDAGLGACGKLNTNSDFIVAMNRAQFDSGDFCFKTITITWHGKSTNAQIVDRCVECPYGALDFSRGLFDFFASQDLGYLYGSWNLAGAAPPKPSPTPKPTPTPSPSPSPTTTKEKPSTTSESKTTSTRKTSTTTSSIATSSTTETSSSTPSATPFIAPVDTISQLNLVMAQIGGVLIGAAAN